MAQLPGGDTAGRRPLGGRDGSDGGPDVKDVRGFSFQSLTNGERLVATSPKCLSPPTTCEVRACTSVGSLTALLLAHPNRGGKRGPASGGHCGGENN